MPRTKTSASRPLVILGCGFVGEEVAKQALGDGLTVFASTRDPKRLAPLGELGTHPFLLPDACPPLAGKDVIVTFPPNPSVEAELVQLATCANRIVYISSTSVYGAQTGTVDHQTPVAAAQPSTQNRLTAETRWQSVGATVLRAPGIYGPGRGLHKRLRSGAFNMTGEGLNYQSRIHVYDLAALCIRALEQGPRGGALLVGDNAPCTQREIVGYLCDQLEMAMPPQQAIQDAHPTLRASRRVNSRHALKTLHYSLRFPTYREGYSQVLADIQ